MHPRPPAASPAVTGGAVRGSGVAGAADLVPFGHPAYFLLVDAIGRRGDGASGGDGQRRAGKDFSVASILRYQL